MMVTVHLDQLYSYSHDPKAVAKHLDAMQRKGLNLNVHVKDPQTAEVFKYLSGAKPTPRTRTSLATLLVFGLLLSFASIAYGVLGLLPLV